LFLSGGPRSTASLGGRTALALFIVFFFSFQNLLSGSPTPFRFIAPLSPDREQLHFGNPQELSDASAVSRMGFRVAVHQARYMGGSPANGMRDFDLRNSVLQQGNFQLDEHFVTVSVNLLNEVRLPQWCVY